ncbi:MAG: S8 family peptidase [Bacteroidales bacterium]|nr:S8 family peptidase [Bacteroidales bacterium]
MNKILLLAFAIALLGFSVADAQVEVHKGLKWDAGTGLLLKENVKSVRASRGTSASADSTLGRFIITVTDAETAVDSIAILGGEARRINDNLVTARIPYSKIEAVAALPSVVYVEAARKASLALDNARKLTRTDSVQTGIELETPYTGEGVIVAVIDQGFQYDHRAFRDDEGNSRVLAVWNRYADEAPTTTIPSGSDGVPQSVGHATYVTGIAAGSVVRGNDYSGMAPGADIVMVPSALYNEEFLEDVQWIKELAEEEGKPWVLNMSLSSTIGPHDGSTTFEQTMNSFCDEGGLIVAAMGNNGESKIHVAHTFETAGDSVYLLFSNDPSTSSNYVDMWSTEADGAEHLNIEIVVYNAVTKTFLSMNDGIWQYCGSAYGEINANNQKEHYTFYADLETLAALLEEDQTNLYLGLKITAKDASAAFHAWFRAGYGEFVAVDGYGLEGDNEYLVGQGSASIPRAIGVGSYNDRDTWTTLSGLTLGVYGEQTGAISSYSSPGPSLGDDLKPTIMAPGNYVISSLDRYTNTLYPETFSKDGYDVVAAVDDDGNALDYTTASFETSHFYGVYSGTSLSSPAVSGILALWLQANPKLTPEDVLEIFKKTAVRDEYTGGAQGDWTPTAGYGKIDAYAGLKMALEKLAAGNHDLTMPATQPVTLKKGADKWRVLFNVAEENVKVSLYSLANGEVSRTTLDEVSPGDETVIDLNAYTPGVYIIKIVTPNATVTRKVVVSH